MSGLGAIEAAATEDGVWHKVAAQRKAAEQMLSTARARYLAQRAALDAVTALADDAEAVTALANNAGGAGGGGAADDSDHGESTSGSGGGRHDADALGAALREVGLNCGASTYRSLAQHLRVARALPRLKLPDAAVAAATSSSGKGGPAAARPSQQADTDAERDGSAAHFLGVTPGEMRAKFCLPQAAAQRAHAGAAREVEARLVALADAMCAAIASGGDGNPTNAANAAQAARDAAAAADAAEADAAALLRRHLTLVGRQLEQLAEAQTVLLQLVEGCAVGMQARLDADHCRWLAAHVRALHSKLRVLQGQLHVATYTSEAAPALRALGAALGEREAAAAADAEAAAAALAAYADAGPELAAAAAEYGAVAAELARVEDALRHFTALERELTDGGGGE